MNIHVLVFCRNMFSILLYLGLQLLNCAQESFFEQIFTTTVGVTPDELCNLSGPCFFFFSKIGITTRPILQGCEKLKKKKKRSHIYSTSNSIWHAGVLRKVGFTTREGPYPYPRWGLGGLWQNVGPCKRAPTDRAPASLHLHQISRGPDRSEGSSLPRPPPGRPPGCPPD